MSNRFSFDDEDDDEITLVEDDGDVGDLGVGALLCMFVLSFER